MLWSNANDYSNLFDQVRLCDIDTFPAAHQILERGHLGWELCKDSQLLGVIPERVIVANKRDTSIRLTTLPGGPTPSERKQGDQQYGSLSSLTSTDLRNQNSGRGFEIVLTDSRGLQSKPFIVVRVPSPRKRLNVLQLRLHEHISASSTMVRNGGSEWKCPLTSVSTTLDACAKKTSQDVCSLFPTNHV